MLAQREEKEIDYLQPFLEQLNIGDTKGAKLTRDQALKLRDDCLSDFKQRLVDRANLIQARFDKVRISQKFKTLLWLLLAFRGRR